MKIAKNENINILIKLFIAVYMSVLHEKKLYNYWFLWMNQTI